MQKEKERCCREEISPHKKSTGKPTMATQKNQENPNTAKKNGVTKTPRDASSPPQKTLLPSINLDRNADQPTRNTHQQSNREIQSVKAQRSHQKLSKDG
jgi:hypothetical protein